MLARTQVALSPWSVGSSVTSSANALLNSRLKHRQPRRVTSDSVMQWGWVLFRYLSPHSIHDSELPSCSYIALTTSYLCQAPAHRSQDFLVGNLGTSNIPQNTALSWSDVLYWSHIAIRVLLSATFITRIITLSISYDGYLTYACTSVSILSLFKARYHSPFPSCL